MKSIIFALVLSLICLSESALIGQKRVSEPIPGRYIFVFNENATMFQKQQYMNSFSEVADHKVRMTYQIGDFHAFSAETSELYVQRQLNNPIIKSVEQDMTVHIMDECHIQHDATWGIDRISERAILLDGDYHYEHFGTGVDAYIIDTGIYVAHTQFEDRASWGATFTGDNNNNDCNGHGTHVAGTVGGTVYGVAKKVSLIAVKVLNCGGSGSWEGVIAGVNWVAQQYAQRKKPSVANMSLGGGLFQALNNAVDAAVRQGVTFAIAAGNNNGDACLTSPASTPSAITVGSTDVANNGGFQQDIRSSFSNWGKCTDVFAPGSMITSAWIGNPTAVRTISGTSMAAPHVCGVVALFLEAFPTASPKQVDDFITGGSTKDLINLNCRAGSGCIVSPNRMIFSACDL